MNYKRSIYNVVIDKLDNGDVLLYNTYSGMYGKADVKTLSIYDDIENVDIDSVADKSDLKNISTMIRCGFIVRPEKDELSTVKLERATARYSQNSLGLTITPTMDCNMCCPYCYEDKNTAVMSAEVQNQLIQFVASHLQSRQSIKNMSVVWYGGEPLMQKEIISNLSKKFIEMCAEKGVEYSSSIVTNGVLLDVETAKMLANDCMIKNAQITIDGMQELHNQRRILLNGEDSFSAIIQNIDGCKGILPISVRVNVDKENADEVETLVKYFVDVKGWGTDPHFYFAPVEKFENESCKIDASSCLLSEEFAHIVNNYERISYAANPESVSRNFFQRRRSVFCGFESHNVYVVDPEGYIYNCWHHIGAKERISGHVSRPFVVNSNYAKWLLNELPGQCYECAYLPMCQGSCGTDRIYNDDETAKCFHLVYTYKNTLKLAYEDYIIQKAKTAKTDAATPVS